MIMNAVIFTMAVLLLCDSSSAQRIEPNKVYATAWPACDSGSAFDIKAANQAASRQPSNDEMLANVAATKEAVRAAKEKLQAALRDPVAAWAEHCAQYGPHMLQDTTRYTYFKANLALAASRNAEAAKSNPDLKGQEDELMAHGITQFSHLSQDEFDKSFLMSKEITIPTTFKPTRRSRPLADAVEPAAATPVEPQAPAADTGAGRRLMQGSVPCHTNKAFPYGALGTPQSWDWRNAGVITPVRNQLGCGSCSAHASIGALESTFIRKWYDRGYRASNTDLSEDDFLECTAGNQCNGAWPDSVFDRYICNGAPFEASQPYNANDGNNCRAIPRYITGATGFSYVPKDGASLAKSVFVNPTVIALDASRWNTFAAGWVRNCGESWSRLNHAVLVVGWVGGVPMSNGETWDFWYVKNSWGPTFNNAGYIWIRKDRCGGDGPFGMYKTNPWTPLM